MPIVADWRVAMSIEEIWQRHETRCQGNIPGRYVSLAPEMVAMVSERGLIRPRIAYEVGAVSSMADGRIAVSDRGEIADADDLIENLTGATELLCAAATIGDGLDGAIAALIAERKMLRALVLEEIAIAALFQLGDQARTLIEDEARARGLRSTGAISPGDHGIGLAHQRAVLALAGADRIGISANAAGMMRPVRSISMVAGFGARVLRMHKRDNCDACKARERCRYRRRDIESKVA